MLSFLIISFYAISQRAAHHKRYYQVSSSFQLEPYFKINRIKTLECSCGRRRLGYKYTKINKAVRRFEEMVSNGTLQLIDTLGVKSLKISSRFLTEDGERICMLSRISSKYLFLALNNFI